MRTKARYYLGRVVKLGELNQERLLEALREPVVLQRNNNLYTFIDIQVIGQPAEPSGVFARLAKFKPEAAVQIVKPTEHEGAEQNVKNLVEASSPFVYLPEFSGIVYQHVWNRLQREHFEKVFGELIQAKFGNFFVSCRVEPVADLRTFVVRLSKLDKINSIRAKVNPPNPLFGPCWGSLVDYMKKRRLDEVTVQEESQTGVVTNIKRIASAMLEEGDPAKLTTMMEPLMGGVGDAALLMAADGYGRAKVEGHEGDRAVVIRTSENQKSFLLDKDPEPAALAEAARSEFSRVSDERYLEHK
jgi:hypothetical protein